MPPISPTTDEFTAATAPRRSALARLIGFLYVLQMATAVFGQVVVRGRLIVRGDAARTAENILGAERLFRLSVVTDLLTALAVIWMSWCLYVLLQSVHRRLALLALVFRLVENAVLCAATVSSLVALRLLSGEANYLKVLDAGSRQALALLALNAQGLALNMTFVPLGLGSAIFAWLLVKSRYVPAALAGFGIFASLMLAIGTLALIVFPALSLGGMAYMAPMGLYEVGLGLWLLAKGINPTASAPPPGPMTALQVE